MKSRTGYLHKRGCNFYVSWRVGGKLFTKALRDDAGQPITSKREAEEAKEKFMAPMAKADEAEVLEAITGRLEGRKAELAAWDEQQNPALPFSQAWTEYLNSPTRPDSGKRTLHDYENIWSAFVTWMQETHPAKLTLQEVSGEMAGEYAGHLNHGRLAANTFNKHINFLALLFRVVKRKARITENPWQDIKRKKVINYSRRELTVDELRKVCQSATGELRLLLALGVYLGLRLGDCATLRWGETDLRRGIVTRIPNKTGRSNPKPVIIPIHHDLRAMLSQIPADARGEYILPKTAALYAHNSSLLTKDIQAHFIACGIKTWKPGTGPDSKEGSRAVLEVGFHSLRHSFVSLMRASNVPLSVVESIVGHSNPAMTRHYTHTGELAAANAVALLPSMLDDAKPVKAKASPESTVSQIKAIAATLTPANLAEKKPALLALLA